MAHRGRQVPQDVVTRQVPVGVVDVLEVINVHNQYTQRMLMTLAVAQQLIGPLKKRPAVIDAGKDIGLRRMRGNSVRLCHFMGQPERGL